MITWTVILKVYAWAIEKKWDTKWTRYAVQSDIWLQTNLAIYKSYNMFC